MTAKRWICFFFALLLLVSTIFIGLTVYIDPLFHYHSPLEDYEYILLRDDERIINDGIMRNWQYDSLIIGSSMMENTKVTDLNNLFGGNFIKTPFFGASLKEISINEKRAMGYNEKLKTIVRSIDYLGLRQDKDLMNYSDDMYPYYLYNNNIFDDVHYLLNKNYFDNYTIPILNQLTIDNKAVSKDMDFYGNWMNLDGINFGLEGVLATQAYTSFAPEEIGTIATNLADCEGLLTDEEHDAIYENIKQNCCTNAFEHPDVQFIYFMTPYSVCYWGMLYSQNDIAKQVASEKVAIEAMLEAPNIRLYSFNTWFDMTCCLDNYKDYYHYGDQINYEMMNYISKGDYLITKDNYLDYLQEELEFYQTYPYETIFEN